MPRSDVIRCNLPVSKFCFCLLRLGLAVTMEAPAENSGTRIHCLGRAVPQFYSLCDGKGSSSVPSVFCISVLQ